ncbi:MAG: cell division protein FtsQ/DivIB [Sporolactobacillus sp.]
MSRKVVPLEDRLPKLKEERKQKANRRFVFYATIFFLLILSVVYFQSPLSRVNHIAISGEQIASAKRILHVSGISSGTHIWDIHSKNVQRQIQKLPSVQKARVSIAFPNRVEIRVQEYSRKAYLMKDGHYYPILQNGAVLSRLPGGKMPADAPMLIGFHEGHALKNVAEGLSHIPLSIIHSISDIHYINNRSGGNDLILYMNDGNRVVASTQTFAKNIRVYPEIAANLPKDHAGIIHLSLGTYFVPDHHQAGDGQ